MKIIILMFILLLGSAAFAESKHFLFFVHGIGGTEKTFGHLPTALEKHLDQANGNMKHESYVFVYPTEDPILTSEDFAQRFADFINLSLKDRLTEGDKISIVSHSQGGIVSLIWYFNAFIQHHQIDNDVLSASGNLLRQSVDYQSQYVPYIDAIITLGTPFWGSKLASKISEDTWASKLVAKKIFPNLGAKQLEEMAFSSGTSSKFRKNITQIPLAVLNEMKKKIRPLNIAGMADVAELFKAKSQGWSRYLKLFSGMTFGAKYWESDTTVPIPSARFDSIYTVDRSTQYADGQTTSIENTQQSQFAPLLIVNAMHASPIPAEIPDMVEVPEICIYNLKCKHPTIKYIYDHLAGYPIPEFGNGVPGNHLGGYMVSFKLNFPAGVTAATQNIGIQMISPAHASDYRVVFREKNDTISNGVVISSKAPNSYMRTDSGHIKYKNHLAVASKNVRKNGQEVTIVIQAQGYRTRYVQTLIKPTYSTYVEVDLILL